MIGAATANPVEAQMTEQLQGAIEAGLLAMSEVDASSRGEAEARRCLEAALPAAMADLRAQGFVLASSLALKVLIKTIREEFLAFQDSDEHEELRSSVRALEAMLTTAQCEGG